VLPRVTLIVKGLCSKVLIRRSIGAKGLASDVLPRITAIIEGLISHMLKRLAIAAKSLRTE
jgi:hypothetical protein